MTIVFDHSCIHNIHWYIHFGLKVAKKTSLDDNNQRILHRRRKLVEKYPVNLKISSAKSFKKFGPQDFGGASAPVASPLARPLPWQRPCGVIPHSQVRLYISNKPIVRIEHASVGNPEGGIFKF